MSKAIETAKKIKALVDKGATEGERRAAQIFLDRIIKKHGLSLSDISEDETLRHYYFDKLLSKDEAQIAAQISVKSYPDRESFYISKGSKRRVGTICTYSEWIDLICQIEFYLADYKKQKSKFMSTQTNLYMRAYVHKHNLFLPNETATASSKTDRGDVLKMMSIMDNIEKKTFHKQLEK